jgi:hypothetical protein
MEERESRSGDAVKLSVSDILDSIKKKTGEKDINVMTALESN